MSWVVGKLFVSKRSLCSTTKTRQIHSQRVWSSIHNIHTTIVQIWLSHLSTLLLFINFIASFHVIVKKPYKFSYLFFLSFPTKREWLWTLILHSSVFYANILIFFNNYFNNDINYSLTITNISKNKHSKKKTTHYM